MNIVEWSKGCFIKLVAEDTCLRQAGISSVNLPPCPTPLPPSFRSRFAPSTRFRLRQDFGGQAGQAHVETGSIQPSTATEAPRFRASRN